jgi:hypothetical protein
VCSSDLCSLRVCIRVWVIVVVKALRYESDGPEIDPRWCHLGFFQ